MYLFMYVFIYLFNVHIYTYYIVIYIYDILYIHMYIYISYIICICTYIYIYTCFPCLALAISGNREEDWFASAQLASLARSIGSSLFRVLASTDARAFSLIVLHRLFQHVSIQTII